MPVPRVLNKRKTGNPLGSVYIGRPTKWGNPFVIGRDGTRSEVVEKYKDWLYTQPELMAAAKKELKGRDLVCYCAPQQCHGDILLLLVNS